MANSSFLCGWCDVERTVNDVDSVRSAMLACFSSVNAEWFSNTHLNIVTSENIANINDKVDVVIVGMPYWKNIDLEKQASEQGHAQVIAENYLKHGMRFLENLAGRFSIVLFDHRYQKLVVCLDRIGQDQIFYAQAGAGLIFSSRADAVVSHPSIDNKINNQGIYNYFYFHAIPSPNSIYQGVNKLENGQYLVFHKGHIATQHYWEPEFSEQNNESIESLSYEMLSIIERSVSRCNQNGSVGAFLSGGLDSSTVAGFLSKISRGNARTFSIGFDAKGYDEMEYARIASKHFGTDQNEYYVTPDDVITQVTKITEYFDEPFGNSSALPAYFCARMAKENGIDRLLAGDGGDELFAGNERYVKQGIFQSYNKIPSLFRRLLLEPVFLHNPVVKYLPIFKKINSYISQAKIPLPDRLETYNFLHQHAASEIFTTDFLCDIDQRQPLETLRNSYQRPGDASFLNRMMWLDWKRTLHDNDLVKVNRMCELAGIEVSYPLLDDELVAYSCRIPSKVKLNNGNLRWFYKQAIKGFLPNEIINKSKQGFGLPFGVWTKEHAGLQELAYDSLTSLKNKMIFRNEFIDNVIRMHKSSHAKYYGELVWVLMTLNIWLDKSK